MMKSRLLTIVIAGGAMLWLMANHATADLILSSVGHTNDAELQEQPDPNDDTTAGSVAVTQQTASLLRLGVVDLSDSDNRARFGMNAIYVFQLPDAPTSPLKSASLAFTLIDERTGANATLWDVDLYGIGFQSDPTLDVNWYFEGAFGTDPNATPLQQAILLKNQGTPPGRVETSATGSANLRDFLQLQYDNGATAGDFVFFRLNIPTDVNTNVNRWFRVASAEDTLNAPELTIVVPEPASAAALALTSVMLLRRRRR